MLSCYGLFQFIYLMVLNFSSFLSIYPRSLIMSTGKPNVSYITVSRWEIYDHVPDEIVCIWDKFQHPSEKFLKFRILDFSYTDMSSTYFKHCKYRLYSLLSILSFTWSVRDHCLVCSLPDTNTYSYLTGHNEKKSQLLPGFKLNVIHSSNCSTRLSEERQHSNNETKE